MEYSLVGELQNASEKGLDEVEIGRKGHFLKQKFGAFFHYYFDAGT